MVQERIHRIGYNVNVPLKSDFMSTLHETTHGELVSVPPYRPKSVQSIHRYADSTLVPGDLGYGNMNKAR